MLEIYSKHTLNSMFFCVGTMTKSCEAKITVFFNKKNINLCIANAQHCNLSGCHYV